MDQLPGTVRAGRSLSFKTHQHQSSSSSSSSSCYSTSSSEIHYPIHGMEFLCRPWSPSAHNFQQLFTSSDLLGDHNFSTCEEPEDRKLELEAINELPPHRSTNTTMMTRVDDMIWMNSNPAKGWLGGKSITSIFRRRREQKKEDIRLHTASVHAALSVTRLAAAIASVAAKNTTESAEAFGGDGPIIGDIVASAAALVTTVCAEAAEALGAQTTSVSSAISSGLATQTTGDVITLTADAATCLRGVAALKARAMNNAYSPRSHNMLQVKGELSVVTPSGSRRYGWASIHYSKHSQLMLSLQKKHLGFLPTKKEYKILYVMEGNQEAKSQGNLSISLRSDDGNIKLLFKDENQTLVWTSSIFNLLQMQT